MLSYRVIGHSHLEPSHTNPQIAHFRPLDVLINHAESQPPRKPFIFITIRNTGYPHKVPPDDLTM
jgi:hypothetical protein